ncbi:MAG TPA: F0F1 ATP synthase subunit delta [Candidatus Dormibacteraeota bacterium]|nr:F0F1 ATP synthase subunit delta [Candidatus Dormibacteraeota bacterium]
MPEVSNVARRYAEGVLQLAKEENAIDRWREELRRLNELLSDDVLVAAFQNPAVGPQRRLELAKLLAPELKPQTENFLRLLVEHQRTREMPAILQAFNQMADEAAGIVHAVFTTAIELGKEDQQRYWRALEERLDRKVQMTFATDPTLMGGATIRVGDHLVDGSIRTQLERLRQELLS